MRRGCYRLPLEKCRRPVHSGRLSAVRRARVEAGVVVPRHVPITSESVVNVLAKSGGVGAFGVANSNAELTGSHEVSPFEDLLELSKATGEDDTSHRVSISIGAVRVQLSSFVICWNVQEGHVSDAGYLNIIWCLQPVCTGYCAVRNETSPRAVFDAPRDLDALGFTDSRTRAGTRRGP